MPLLTPDTLAGSVSALITIPDDLALKAAVIGALAELGVVYNWEQFGAQTPEDTAQKFVDLVSDIEWGYIPPTGGIMPGLHEVVSLYDTGFSDIITVPFETVVTDPGNWWDSVSNSFIVPGDGVYLVTANVAITSNATLTLIINTDSGYKPIGGSEGGSGVANIGGSCMLNLAAGDFVSLLCRTSSPATLHPTSERAIRLQIAMLG